MDESQGTAGAGGVGDEACLHREIYGKRGTFVFRRQVDWAVARDS
ncbi:CpeT protein [Streptococcus sanguinis SK330]|uniref:CpeT protein n=1 Tax=Streptococcus sanguinis SK330 TaxID=888813 RepID=F2CB06_STRSA|nr:CpeT protein [Streptococcus sanguinis SK330]